MFTNWYYPFKSRFSEMFGDLKTNPFHWKQDILKGHIDLLSGYPFKSDTYTDKGINICGGLIIDPGEIRWKDAKHIGSPKGFENYLLKANDIVMALDRPWISDGFKVALVKEDDKPALLIQRTARIRPIDIDYYYLYELLNSESFKSHCSVTGSLVPHISTKDIELFKVNLPPISLQREFAAFKLEAGKSKVASIISHKRYTTIPYLRQNIGYYM